MKIIGFAQLHNEEEKGNLENWFKCMDAICDHIYIFDQHSTDYSITLYRKYKPKTVIYFNDKNDFGNEISCKAKLLALLLRDHPDVDWIFWMDGDTILDARLQNREELEKMLGIADKVQAGAITLGHLNLWRSDTYYRLDSKYHQLDYTGVVAFWKNNGMLFFDPGEGLHRPQYPFGLDKLILSYKNYKLIHRGFCNEEQIFNRYLLYRQKNRDGIITNEIGRLINEEELEVKRIDNILLPKWFEIKDDVNPKEKPRLYEYFNKYDIDMGEIAWK